MPAFKKLGPGDQIDNVLVLEPQWTLVSGSSGWRGSPEGSASLNLYGGVNRAPGGVVREYQYEPTIPAQRTYGQLRRTTLTSSVEIVRMTDEDLNIASRSRTRWGREHFKTVMRLYEFYGRRNSDYVTASYDHYCLYFNSGSTNIVTVYDRYFTVPSGVTQFRTLPTGSYTFEAWFKPFTTGSAGNNLTIFSRRNGYSLFVDGASGKLVWRIHSGTAVSAVAVTGSTVVTPRQWHHAAVTFNSTTRTGTLYLDLQDVGTFTYPGSGIRHPINWSGSFHIGAEWGGALSTRFEAANVLACGLTGTVFHGFIGQVRVWGVDRTQTQISSSYNVRLTGSALGAPLLADLRLSEGPLARACPAADPSSLLQAYRAGTVGSGVLDYAASHQAYPVDFGVLYSFDSRPGPVWHPNDNTNFYLPKERAVTFTTGTYWSNPSTNVERMVVFHIPSSFYGRQIQPNSVRITDNTWSDPSYGLVRTIIDDGRGGLYISGSAAAPTPPPAKASGTYVAGTGSLILEDLHYGPGGNGRTVTFQWAPMGMSTWVNETDPMNLLVWVRTDPDLGIFPIATYQEVADALNTSKYVRVRTVTGAADIFASTPTITFGGGVFGGTQGGQPSVQWNKVGNVFYEDGLIIIKDPSLLDIGTPAPGSSVTPQDLVQLEFRGQSRIPVKTIMARIDRGELNRSLNPSYYRVEEDGFRSIRHPSGNLYVTTVGLYNSDRELVGVARLAEPLRVRPRDRFAIKIRMDF